MSINRLALREKLSYLSARTKAVKNSKFNLLTDVDESRRSKAVRLTEKQLQIVSDILPNGFDILTTAVPISEEMTFDEWLETFVDDGDKDNLQLMASEKNNWSGANPISHTSEELEELNQYAEERGIKLYQRQPFDGDISIMKSEIDTIERIRNDFNLTDYIQLGWKKMRNDDFGQKSANHQQIWINRLALRDRSASEGNLAAYNWLAANTLEGIAAHEMGHVISGKLKKGVTGLDIYKQTVYNVSGKSISDDEALDMLSNYISRYSASGSIKSNGDMVFNKIIPEMLRVHYTKPNKYSSEYVRLLKEACKK